MAEAREARRRHRVASRVPGLVPDDATPKYGVTSRDVTARIQTETGGRVTGYVVDPDDLQKRFVVEILGDGITLAIVRADMHVRELLEQGLGDGCYGFAIAPDPRFPAAEYELLLANDLRAIARWSAASEPSREPQLFSSGCVLWRGGLRLSGTVTQQGSSFGDLPAVQVFEGARRVEGAVRLHPGVEEARSCDQFDLLLPATLADGCLHRLRVLSPAGIELEGSPVSLLAHPSGYGGLQPRFDEQTRAFLDRLIPASLPFESYQDWARRHADDAAFDGAASSVKLGVLILGRTGHEATFASLRRQHGEFVIRVRVLDTDNPDCPTFSQAVWQAARADLAKTAPAAVLIMRAGAVLKPHACLALSAAFGFEDPARDDVWLCVADHELADRDGTSTPLFGPVFDYERLLSQGYAEGLFAVRKLPDIADDDAERLCSYDILLAALEMGRASGGRLAQIPHVLGRVPRLDPETGAPLLADAVRWHLARCGDGAAVEIGNGRLLPLVHVRRPRPEGEVAIIIPTRDRLDLLRPCISSIAKRTDRRDYRLVLVDNGSRDQETLDYLRELSRQGAVVLRDDRSFNFARLNNLAMAEIASPFACLLNNDVEVLTDHWLAAMQAFFGRQAVGAVGAKLLWPNGMLQHGGVVLGMNFAAGHAYDRYLAEEAGYADGILAARECSALTAACLLVRREDFVRVGGFDEQAFPVTFNDVDLCLKLREEGKALVWSPQVQLLHRESASRMGDHQSPAKQARFDRELAALRRRWGHLLVDDPYYNPNLNLDAYAFTGLALPPRNRAARVTPLQF